MTQNSLGIDCSIGNNKNPAQEDSSSFPPKKCNPTWPEAESSLRQSNSKNKTAFQTQARPQQKQQRKQKRQSPKKGPRDKGTDQKERPKAM